jgi:hypothetical protein
MDKKEFLNTLKILIIPSPEESFKNGIHKWMVTDVDTYQKNVGFWSSYKNAQIDYKKIDIQNRHIIDNENNGIEDFILYYLKDDSHHYLIRISSNTSWSETYSLRAKEIKTILDEMPKLIKENDDLIKLTKKSMSFLEALTLDNSIKNKQPVSKKIKV